MPSTHIACPHCHTSHVRQVRYKSTFHAVLRNGLFGALSLKENAAASGSKTLENYCCLACGLTFTPALRLEPPKMILN